MNPRVRTQALVAVVVAVLAFYLVMVGLKGVAFVREGSPVAVVLGLAVLAIPVVGAWLVWREVQFGRGSARLARDLEAEGGLPEDDLPRRPSGRVDRAAAEEVFTVRKAEVDSEPESWRAWYRLAVAYDDAGDRPRARSAARRAIHLHQHHDHGA